MSVNRQYFYILYFLFLSSPILVKFKTVERLPSPGRASARHRFPWQPFTVLNLTKIGVFRHGKKTLVLPLEEKLAFFLFRISVHAIYKKIILVKKSSS